MSETAARSTDSSSNEAARLLRDVAERLQAPPGTSVGILINRIAVKFGWKHSRCRKLWHREARVRPEELDVLREETRGRGAQPQAQEAADAPPDPSQAILHALDRLNQVLDRIEAYEQALEAMARVEVESPPGPSLAHRAAARGRGSRYAGARA